MKAGDVVSLAFSTLYREVSAPLRRKHGAAWCLGEAGANAAGNPVVRCAVAEVLFDAPPTLEQVQGLELKVRRVPPGRDEPGVYLLEDQELPRGVTLLGTLRKRPRVTRKEATFITYGAWSNLVIAWDAAWRREQGAAKETAARARETAKAEAATRKRRSRGLAGVPLAPVLAKLVSKRRAAALATILREGVEALSKSRTRKARLGVLEATVTRLNDYDEAQRGFIDTAESEALLECLEDLAAVCGLADAAPQLDRWRDW